MRTSLLFFRFYIAQGFSFCVLLVMHPMSKWTLSKCCDRSRIFGFRVVRMNY